MILTDYPWYFTLLCLLAGAVYAAVLYFVGGSPFGRGWRWVLAVLRFVAVSVIAFLLLAPMTKQTVNERQKPHVVLAQDVSQSVSLEGLYVLPLKGLIPKLEEHCRVSYVEFGDASSTNIGAVLERYRGDDVAALVLASDGLHNRGANPTSVAERLQFPVHCLAMGDTTPQRDARVANLRCNRIALLGSRFPIELTVAATLLESNGSRLTIQNSAGKQLYAQTIDYSDDDYSVTVGTTLPAEEPGLQRFTVQLAPAEGEVSTANNTLSFFVDVIDTRHKVAIIANAPHPDVAALRHAIEGNPNYEVVTATASEVESGKWKAEGDVSLMVLHNLPSREHPSVDYADGLPKLFVIGTQTDLSRLNALHSGLEITAKVQRTNEVTAQHAAGFQLFTFDESDANVIEALPPLTAPFGEARLSADVQSLFTARLGNIDTRLPLVAATAQGAERRAWIWGEGLWHWRLAEWQTHESHACVDRLVSQLVSFTAQQSSRNRLQVEAERSYAEGEPIALRAVLYNENYETVNDAEVQISIDTLKYTFRRDADAYSLTLPPLREGVYRYRATADGQEAEGSFAVESMNLEQQGLAADHSLLATLCALTGGEMYTPSQILTLGEKLSSLKPTIYTHTRYAEFLRLPLVLALIILLLAAEWVLRKYHGEI